MNDHPLVDTEPDDAFAAVLGDIDSSPLMRAPLPAQAAPVPERGVACEAGPEPQARNEKPAGPVSLARGAFAVEIEGAVARVIPKLAMMADVAGSLWRLLRELEAQGVQSVTLDLAKVVDMDADCLAALLAFCGESGGPVRLRLANANPGLAGLFAAVRLDTHFAIGIG